MIDFISGLIPGAIFVRRYAKSSIWPELFGLFLMEIFPYLLVAYMTESSLVSAAFGYVLLYSFYEFGYIYNDTISAQHETVGRTDRDLFNKWKYREFLSGRCLTMFLCFLYLFESYQVKTSIIIILNLTLLMFCFYIHNSVKNVKYRTGTFLFLNLSKIAFRLVVISYSSLYFIVSCIPHLFVKLIEYLNAKQVIDIEKDSFNILKVSVYVSVILALSFYDWKLAVVALPYMLNHCKKNALEFVRS